MVKELKLIFDDEITVNGNLISKVDKIKSLDINQGQTSDVFSNKWTEVDSDNSFNEIHQFQFEWFLKLYGFETEADLRKYLVGKPFIVDAGCGLGYKAAWLAKLAPNSIVIGIDISDAAIHAAKRYKDVENLFFLNADIADTGIKNNTINFTICDQVIMHTEVPELTFKHLSEITSKEGEFACYVYRIKALPRELIDDYFRNQTHNISKEDMWEFSQQLTQLGKALSELNVSFNCPEIPALGIKAGEYDVQRFIYWNFLKCFYNKDWSASINDATNYDWYAPSNAKRYSKEEFEAIIDENKMKINYFHAEEACYSGRFIKV